MQVSSSSVARPWELEQNTSGQASGLEGLKAMEIGENNVTKKVPVLVLKTYEKAGAQKWASPVYADSSSVIQSPLRAIQLDTDADEATLCYVVQSLQVPSAQQYQDLMTAIYHKDVMELSYLLGKGLDLTGVTMEGGHTSTLVA